MSSAKLGAMVTTLLTLVYVFLLGNSALRLLSSGSWIGVLMGSFLIAFPIVGVVFIAIELRFGFRIEKLASRLEQSGAWPQFDFEYRPSGRVVRTSAMSEFEKYQKLAESNRSDWKAWFALGLVYDAAGDRARARASMRKALSLANNS